MRQHGVVRKGWANRPIRAWVARSRAGVGLVVILLTSVTVGLVLWLCSIDFGSIGG